jgi:tetratricopeptide (TPR) repeat protein
MHARSSLRFYLAQTLLFFKQHARALRTLERLVEADPAHARAWSIAAFLYAEKGRLKEAGGAFERALALDPADAPNLFNAGFVLQRLGRHDEAIERFQRALEIDPSIDRAWYGLGLSLVQRGRYREAIDRLSEASRLQPFNPFARYQLAAAWFKLGEPEKVRAEYRHVKGFDPTVAEHIRADFGVPRDPD